MSKFFKKFSLFAMVFASFAGAAYAALVPNNVNPTARPSIVAANVMSAAGLGPRMPTLRYQGTTTTGTTTTTTGTTCTGTACSYLSDKECIDQYTSCIKGSDVCGSNFENCTNKTLFFAAKGNCTSTLLQCYSTGVNQLFGVSDRNVLATQSTTIKDDFGNYIYIYPTDNSIMGSMIAGAAISQQLSTQDCVKKYTQCLGRDEVCGSDFALCTTDKAFKTQKLFCQSTLARCGNTALNLLWGTTDTTSNPMGESIIRGLIDEGANLAAANSVATCYKIADQCILKACGPNPYRCKVGAEQSTSAAADNAANPDNSRPDASTAIGMASSAADSGPVNLAQIKGFVRNSCIDLIGGSQYCYTTVNGSVPTPSQLKDQDNVNDTFNEIFGSRFNAGMRAKIDDMITAFDKKQKMACQTTIVNCAMRNCGGGVGSVCYSQAYDTTNNATDVTLPAPFGDIKAGCEAIVNADPACIYSAATFDMSTGTYIYSTTSLFTQLFTSPNATTGAADPVGAVAALNARLASSFNTAALTQLRTQCEQVAQSCVKSMCGQDYVNCFRNRNDVVSSIGGMPDNTAVGNRVAGVLDRAIIIGLCIPTVKDNPSCQQHIQVEAAKLKTGTLTNANTLAAGTSAWGGATTVAQGWIDGGAVSYYHTGLKTDNKIQMTDANGNLLCLASESNTADYGRCDGSDDQKDATGKTIKTYNIPFMVATDDYAVTIAQNQIFQALIQDMELNAQAIYNSKMTQQMNMCHQQNSGGIMGKNDMYSDFMWSKLRVKKIPADYSVNGLKDTDIIASNDLYGSFCRVRVSIKSSEPMINQLIQQGKITDASGQKQLLAISDKSWTFRNFAVGDAFTCGSWIPQDMLQKISQVIYDQKHADATKGQSTTRGWLTALGSVVGAVGGGIGMNALQNGSFGGLLGTNPAARVDIIRKQNCEDAFQTSINAIMNYPNNYAVRSTPVYNPGSTTEVLGYTYRMVGANTNISSATMTATQDRISQQIQQAQAQKDEADLKVVAAQNLVNDAQNKLFEAQQAVKNAGVNEKGITQASTEQKQAVTNAEGTLRAAQQQLEGARTISGNLAASAGNVGNLNNTGYVLVSTAIQEMQTNKARCGNPDSKGNNFWSSGGGKTVLNAVGTIGGGVLGGIVVNKLVKSSQDASADAASLAAQKDWMDNVGNQILCYIGSDQIGQFGDIRSTSME